MASGASTGFVDLEHYRDELEGRLGRARGVMRGIVDPERDDDRCMASGNAARHVQAIAARHTLDRQRARATSRTGRRAIVDLEIAVARYRERRSWRRRHDRQRHGIVVQRQCRHAGAIDAVHVVPAHALRPAFVRERGIVADDIADDPGALRHRGCQRRQAIDPAIRRGGQPRIAMPRRSRIRSMP